MMSLLSSDTPSTVPTVRRLAWYGLLLAGAMVALWAGAQAVAMPASSPEPTPQASDSTAAAPSSEAGTASEIEVFTWGNIATFLLLAGGGGAALYLRQQRRGTSSSTPFQRLGKLGLGPSKHVHLVACGGDVLLLSVTEDEVALLKTYSPDAFEEAFGAGDVDSPVADAFPAPSSKEWSGSFADVLNRFADRTPPS